MPISHIFRYYITGFSNAIPTLFHNLDLKQMFVYKQIFRVVLLHLMEVYDVWETVLSFLISLLLYYTYK